MIPASAMMANAPNLIPLHVLAVGTRRGFILALMDSIYIKVIEALRREMVEDLLIVTRAIVGSVRDSERILPCSSG
jgi:hypothetical protein